ncbi:unnamed protein product [Adineta ricciae]|uniref:Uncharacterized protein n=1 Tax=Adineta ricciae TaxID=249248 RepID=A0A814JPM1_ADIRI|nr:unnamed protein product [Adineta ricciae]
MFMRKVSVVASRLPIIYLPFPMQPSRSTHRTRWRTRRFWRLFHRQKPASIDITYTYENLLRFPRLPITVPPLVPTLMSYRWNDEDDCEPVPKKPPRDAHYQQHFRRRLPKRYSDIVGPTTTKVNPPRREFTFKEKESTDAAAAVLSPRNHRQLSSKPNKTEDIYTVNAPNKKTNETVSSVPRTEKYERSNPARRYNSKNKRLASTNAVDLLAHRMQAAMSAELMHSLDRNFVFGDKKQTASYLHMNRSYSFNISTPPPSAWWQKSIHMDHHYYMIPRVKTYLDDEQKSIETIQSLDEPTPDYEEEIVIQENQNDQTDEEPAADYEDSTVTPASDHTESPVGQSAAYDLGVSSSFVLPQNSLTPSSEACTQDESSVPPTPPPLPSAIFEQKNITFRCRTIADTISADHKLILKDETEIRIKAKEEKQTVSKLQTPPVKKSPPISLVTSKPCYLHLSKEILQKTTLRKVSQPVSRSYSTYGSMSHLNEHDTESTTLRGRHTVTNDDQAIDGLSSSATTSIVIENEYEHRTSSKIYNDYKRRASSINISTTKSFNGTYNHASHIHPIHTHIGLRSSTSSSSTIDKTSDLNLSNKQMDVGIINQLNEHLSVRFRKQQQEICSRKSTHTILEDSTNQLIDNATNDTQNHYDEPHLTEVTQITPIRCSGTSTTSIPPPPPPLPVGGFRSVVSQSNRPFSSQRTSITTLAREPNGLELGCNTGTSTTSSKLSDTQILQELRTNPLFTKAKQYLEIEPGSNGRRSGRRLNESAPYLRLETCSKGVSSDPQDDDSGRKSFLMCSADVNFTIEAPSKSNNCTKNEIKRINSRTFTKSFLQTQCRQSELEVIFQKRAQRSEQNLT